MSGETFIYKGEGLDGDQDLTVANKALINANTDGRLIFGFHQEEPKGKWKYIGILEVIDFDYAFRETRKVYEFKLIQKKIPSIGSVVAAQNEIQEISNLSSPVLKREQNDRVSQVKVKIRGEAFRRQIKSIYRNTCVVCEKTRFTKAHYPEVQSAHIFPVELDGSDDLRNGLALCRLHHWAFDGGLFSISDSSTVMVYPNLMGDKDYSEITVFEGKSLLLPIPEKYRPDPLFLGQHRMIHGYH